MASNIIPDSNPPSLMVLGTTSGAGKSLIATAICRRLLRKGEIPLPFKGQNMSNNAWVDETGGEMAFSQAMQSWAARVSPLKSNQRTIALPSLSELDTFPRDSKAPTPTASTKVADCIICPLDFKNSTAFGE